MPQHVPIHLLVYWLSVGAALYAGAGKVGANEPAVAGYRSYEQLRRELEVIAGDEAAAISSLGTTLGGREVYVLTLSVGDDEAKPAILLVGSVHAPHLVGSELAARMARRLVEGAKADESVRRVLQEQTIYIIPLPSPDASEAFFHKPYFERRGNARAIDDDRDGRTNEDGPEDLNGDGQITLMRIEDPAGKYMPHPDDDRILIEADAKKGEQGRFRLVTEGIDNDQDEAQGEDGPGGVAFDRNFTFEYPYFQPGAGPHQVSEPETRAIADFVFDHPNIYLVYSFSPHDNLMHPWKSGQDRGNIPVNVHADDVPFLDYIAKKYQELLDADGPLEPPAHEGSFVHWAYFHSGRWSLGTRGWWVPKIPQTTAKETDGNDSVPDESDTDGTQAADGDETAEDSDARTEQDKASDSQSVEKRGEDDVKALRWMKERGIDGFAEWTPFTHPDYPERRVEVGGFHPYLRLNPPADALDELAESHTRFLLDLAALRPRLTVSIEKMDDLGRGVFRITARVRNDGYLPTESAMGSRADALQRLEMRIELPEAAWLVHGVQRASIGRLVGHGGEQEREWLVHVPDSSQSKSIKIVAGSPSAGTAETTKELP
jgi:hypothetical protein